MALYSIVGTNAQGLIGNLNAISYMNFDLV